MQLSFMSFELPSHFIGFPYLKKLDLSWLLGNSSKFSQLKYLQLSFFIDTPDLNNILSLASFLRVAPFIEKLDMHILQFAVCGKSDCSELIKRIPRCTYNYLKNLYITGFAGYTGQVEFLVHIVESAPNLEVLTIDRANYLGNDEEYQRRIRVKALDIVKKHLDGSISQHTKFFLM
ncbi:hypothetical protein PR202_gb03778 [Eleusine coracana subsp. coracana]|uniref:At1g61320/AtMIF1 LRR domain-containing protein n=1 Tax=Eleusine coracana subsp. coracana TaxID=191504 RepID=A0AAV5E235_ELECO|nr:hypothetical protein PR202_gb03778 [Eleusine coracana subsp. coracana]